MSIEDVRKDVREAIRKLKLTEGDCCGHYDPNHPACRDECQIAEMCKARTKEFQSQKPGPVNDEPKEPWEILIDEIGKRWELVKTQESDKVRFYQFSGDKMLQIMVSKKSNVVMAKLGNKQKRLGEIGSVKDAKRWATKLMRA